MEDDVPLPHFPGDPIQQTSAGDILRSAAYERNHYQYHFLAMLALRRLISRSHAFTYEYERVLVRSEPLWQGNR
jgi:hypothetical protein